MRTIVMAFALTCVVAPAAPALAQVQATGEAYAVRDFLNGMPLGVLNVADTGLQQVTEPDAFNVTAPGETLDAQPLGIVNGGDSNTQGVALGVSSFVESTGGDATLDLLFDPSGTAPTVPLVRAVTRTSRARVSCTDLIAESEVQVLNIAGTPAGAPGTDSMVILDDLALIFVNQRTTVADAATGTVSSIVRALDVRVLEPASQDVLRVEMSGARAIVTNLPNTCAVFGTPILGVVKTPSFVTDGGTQNAVDAGDRLKYTVAVTNTGSAGGDTVVFTDRIPTNLTVDINSVMLNGAPSAATIANCPGSINFNGCAGEPPSDPNRQCLMVTGGNIAPVSGTMTLTYEGTANSSRSTCNTVHVDVANGAPAQAAAIVMGAQVDRDTPGIYSTSSAAFFLKNSFSPGPADISFQYGPQGGVLVVEGDWDGNDTDTVGIYVRSTGNWFLRNAHGPGPADVTFSFGPAGSSLLPIAGDWDGDGDDSIGLYSVATGDFFLKNDNTNGPADLTFNFGGGNALPIAGNWDGAGGDGVGVYRPSTGTFFLKNANANGPADVAFQFGPATNDHLPLAGDYNGDGTDTIGVYDTTQSIFRLRNANSPGPPFVENQFGKAIQNPLPLVGNWDGN